jgi:hypothetical protein
MLQQMEEQKTYSFHSTRTLTSSRPMDASGFAELNVSGAVS